jgi:hypothetical protein
MYFIRIIWAGVACAEANSTIRLIIAQNLDVLMNDCSHGKGL